MSKVLRNLWAIVWPAGGNRLLRARPRGWHRRGALPQCHRGYTSQEISTWRSTLEYFDAIRVGLTATPASHTTAFFTHKVFEYSYEQAVKDGHLVDYDAVNIRSNARMSGVFLEEGENVERNNVQL